MHTSLMRNEKLAVAVKDTIIKLYCVGIIVAIEGKLEILELKSFPFFRIVLGLLNLADHPIVHDLSPFQYKKARVRTRASQQSNSLLLVVDTRIGLLP